MKKEDLKTNEFFAVEITQSNRKEKYYRAVYKGVIKSINENLYKTFYHLQIDIDDNLDLDHEFVEHVDNQIIELFEMVPQRNIVQTLTLD